MATRRWADVERNIAALADQSAKIRREERDVADADLAAGRRVLVHVRGWGVLECRTQEAYDAARRGALVDGARVVPLEPMRQAFNPYRDDPAFYSAVARRAREFWPCNGPVPAAYRREDEPRRRP